MASVMGFPPNTPYGVNLSTSPTDSRMTPGAISSCTTVVPASWQELARKPNNPIAYDNSLFIGCLFLNGI